MVEERWVTPTSHTEMLNSVKVSLSNDDWGILDMDSAMKYRREEVTLKSPMTGKTYKSVIETINYKKEFLGFRVIC